MTSFKLCAQFLLQIQSSFQTRNGKFLHGLSRKGSCQVGFEAVSNVTAWWTETRFDEKKNTSSRLCRNNNSNHIEVLDFSSCIFSFNLHQIKSLDVIVASLISLVGCFEICVMRVGCNVCPLSGVCVVVCSLSGMVPFSRPFFSLPEELPPNHIAVK